MRPYFDAERYIQNVALTEAKKVCKSRGSKAAQKVYEQCTKSGRKYWAYFLSRMAWYDAEPWLRKVFGREIADRKTSENSVKNSELRPGPELWATACEMDYQNISRKVAQIKDGNKSESNTERIKKSVANDAYIFLSVKPDFYKSERHGKWISESMFHNMLKTCGEIIAKYGDPSLKQKINAA